MVDRKRIEITHLVWLAGHGESVPTDKQINHHCDNPSCFRLDHLYLGTAKENTADLWDRGSPSLPVGEQQWSAKLTDQAVRDIRREHANGGVTYRQLADKYGVGLMTIGRVVRRDTWTHIH
jgi:hypothetical protein